MTGILVLIVMGLLGYGVWRIVGKSAPIERRKCSVCDTSKRALEWMQSWDDWYCLQCKEECIQLIVNTLIGERG
jgi:hypothetical protein